MDFYIINKLYLIWNLIKLFTNLYHPISYVYVYRVKYCFHHNSFHEFHFFFLSLNFKISFFLFLNYWKFYTFAKLSKDFFFLKKIPKQMKKKKSSFLFLFLP